jgi:DNA primase
MKTEERFVGFDTLKRAVSMAQVLDRYGLTERLRRSGDSLSGVCPLHQGHNPTQFRVSLVKNCWICFGDCHTGGSIVDFVGRKEGVGIREAALLIQDWFGVQPSAVAPPINGNRKALRGGHGRAGHNGADTRPAVNPPLRFTLQHLDPCHPYLTARGLSKETVETFGLGYCANGLLAGWMAIPIHNATGQLVAYAGRWPGPPPEDQPKYKLPRGFRKSLELFNLHRARAAETNQPLVVVEGFFGCMLVWQGGHRRVVSLMGSLLSKAQEELIVATVGRSGRVLLLFDEDAAGRKGRAEARSRLAERVKVKVIAFATEGTQPDQLPPGRLLELLR